MNDLLDAALSYAARGWPVFPCAPGAKVPAIAKADGGNGVLDATTDEARIRTWWQQMPDANIGIATGGSAPDVIDVDVKEANGFAALAEASAASLCDGANRYVLTPSGGLHVYYAGTGQRNGRIKDRGLDFRASGGYVLAPPSVVDGKPYRLSSEQPGAAAAVDWAAIRAFLQPPPDPVPFSQPARDRATPDGELRPGDDWANSTSWADILAPHGWTLTRDLGGGRARWRRPGKRDGSSATTREDGGLYVFSSSAEFEVEVPYSKFGALALLDHGGSHAAAASALRAAGYGTPAPQPAITFAQPSLPADGQQDAADSDGEAPHSSWHPRDLTAILDGDASGDPPPAFLARDDGKMLLYAGKVNALIGESESGKTWIALAAVVQALHAGQHVVYLDFEDAPAGIVGRLVSLGATRAQVEKLFRYISPDEPLTQAAVYDLAAVLAEPAPDLAVVDGVNAAMTLLGLNLKDNKDVTEFSQRLLRPIKRTGAAVLTVDHVTKDKENRGSYAIGAQAKRADIDGVAYLVDAVKKFGRGQEGKLRLTVSKDRPGHVRAISDNSTYAGMATLTPHDNGTITIEISAPDQRQPGAERPKFRPTGFMERISVMLEDSDTGESKRGIRDAIRGNNPAKDAAIDRLIEEGYAARDGQKIRSLKPYREAAELQMPVPVPTVPEACPSVPTGTVEIGPGGTVPTVPRSGTTSHGARGTGTPRSGGAEQDHEDDRAHGCTRCGEIGSHAPGCESRP